MIRSKTWAREKTNPNGVLKLKHSFRGYLIELDVDYGELGSETKFTFTTSTGRTWELEGNESSLFPIMPRQSSNEERVQNLGIEPVINEKYVNAGEFVITFENADPNKLLGHVEIIYEE